MLKKPFSSFFLLISLSNYANFVQSFNHRKALEKIRLCWQILMRAQGGNPAPP
jgi:hypothetical protein